MGNIIPESIMMGVINTIADINNAINWVLAMVETSKPSDKAKRIYIVDTKKIENDSSETSKSTEKGITIKAKNNYKITDYKKREGEYKAANISDVANMLKRD